MSKGTVIIGFLLSFAAGMAIMWTVDRSTASGDVAKDEAATASEGQALEPGAVKVDLYVMSKCPYGVKAGNAFAGVAKQLGGNLDLDFEYIGQKSASGELTSMHGPDEVKGDIAQLCAKKLSRAKYVDFIACQNKSANAVATNWRACGQQAGLPAAQLESCIEGSEGQKLLAESFERSKQRGARGSPTIYIAGQKYQGGRRTADLMRAVCAAHQQPKPAACKSIPEAPKVNVTLLSDKRCAECDLSRQERMVRARLANPVITKLDYSDARGKALYQKLAPVNLPAMVFDSTLAADKEGSATFSRGARQVGSYKVLTMRASWNPTCADDGGCERQECKSTLQCRPEEPNKLEVFVMSHCPYGVRGLDAMKEVLSNFDNKIDFQVHYIGNGDAASGLESMHGQTEVDEDLRDLCAMKHYGKKFKFMDYVWCRNKNIRSDDWKSCTGGGTGLEPSVIDKCSTGDEGKKLLDKSFKVSASLGIGASPTWLANGRYKFSGIDAETIKTNFCKHNDLPGCKNTLSGKAAAAPSKGCGG